VHEPFSGTEPILRDKHVTHAYNPTTQEIESRRRGEERGGEGMKKRSKEGRERGREGGREGRKERGRDIKPKNSHHKLKN
jgi:hypothetical protein